jgi:hypothetical protein
MNTKKSICALNENKDSCLSPEIIKAISGVAISDQANTNIIKVSESLDCDTSLSKQEQELCVLKKIKKKTDIDDLKASIDKQILKNFKIPAKSLDKNYWLNNTEIDNVQFQLQNKFDGYYYSTIHMIDLENFKPNNDEIVLNNDKLLNIKDINFVNELSKNSKDKIFNFNNDLKYFGVVCNTDLSSNRGIHWFSIFIDFTKNPIQIEYFNSSGYSLTKGTHINQRKEFYKFFKDLADELTRNGFPAKFIQVTEIEHQAADTANCGSYSLYYIHSRLKGINPSYFAKTKITDAEVEKFRSVLWRAEK